MRLRFVIAEKKGRDLFTTKSIAQDTLIIEYVGKQVSAVTLAELGFDNSYVMQSRDGMINGSCRGNEPRFINHSCDPNLVLEDWQVRRQSRIVFKSTRFIPEHTELTFFYNRDGGEM
jgi:SET domain-containing protein